jgi:hypothetical protein
MGRAQEVPPDVPRVCGVGWDLQLLQHLKLEESESKAQKTKYTEYDFL